MHNNTPQTLTIDLGDRSYPIYIGHGVLKDKDLLGKHLTGKQVLVVSNKTIAPLLKNAIAPLLQGVDYKLLELADGETHKNLQTLNEIYTFLLTHNYDRHCTLIALGGGVIGDITGFAAATYQRGVNFIQIPTTLLAQVDSSVGGKTGVNHPLGKNMIGAFYQPRCVVADTQVLATLPDRELSAGLAEVIKYGLIRDMEFLSWLETNMSALRKQDNVALVHAIGHSCQIKAAVVMADEREQGVRAILNLGHTFGHAIETHTGYTSWLHGEAVAVGMLMASEFSQRCGWISGSDVGRVRDLIAAAGLPTQPPQGMTADDFLRHMKRDKKVKAGVINLVLLQSLGTAVISDNYPASLLLEFLEQQTANKRE
jgi:3-dehydroquinate synthase